jgi:flagellar hook assembly protein FlgD
MTYFHKIIQKIGLVALSLIIFGMSLLPTSMILARNNSISADGAVPGADCADYWGSAYDGLVCYIRGILSPVPLYTEFSSACTNVTGDGVNPGTITHAIQYSSGPRFRFCFGSYHSHPLTGQEAIMKVKYFNSVSYNVLEGLQSYENYNQTPNQPNLIRPQNGWELGPRTNGTYTGITCNTTGTGLGCSTQFNYSIDDPDYAQYIHSEFQIRNTTTGGNQDVTDDRNGGPYTQTKTLTDGNWRWRGITYDTWRNSGWTGYRNFVVDTTAPSTPVMTAEPEFTPSTQNEVGAPASTDSLYGNIQYYFEASTVSDFSTIIANSGWISSSTHIFASLTDETQYFYRMRARDGLWNQTSWSNTVQSIQDATLPVLQNVNQDINRISPINADGNYDSVNISLEYIEKYKNQTRLEVYDVLNSNIVRTISIDDSSLPQDLLPIAHNFTWDGKDDSGNYVADGNYDLQLVVEDKAGNLATDTDNFVIVDNLPADISISNPADGSWFNAMLFSINGQTESDATLQAYSYQLSAFSSVTLDSLGLFTHPDILNDGENIFDLTSTDIVGNINTDQVKYYKETTAPSVDVIKLDGTIPSQTINRQPAISIELSDTGFNDGTNNYVSGVDKDSLFISLTHDTNGELVLVNNGVNVQPSLGTFTENCSTQAGTFGNSKAENCTATFTFTADLTPDGNYSIKTYVSDVAGNDSSQSIANFELDSTTQNDISEPTNNELFNYSIIQLSGTAEKGSTLNISVTDVDGDGLADSETFTIDDNDPSTPLRVTINNCRASSSPETDGIKEICDWSVSEFQLERDLANPGNVTNPISFNLTDVAGNTLNKIVNVDVDLYAVSLSTTTDLQYFSPNGDGRQDGVSFEGISTNGLIDNYELVIKNSSGDIVKTFTGSGTPPSNIPWSGMDEDGNFVPDGDYTYSLKITTTDGISFETTPSIISAVTNLTDAVIITYPKNDSYSTRGVTNVQGQAPANTTVRICVDVIGLDGECNAEYYSPVDSYGSFSTVIPLYRLDGQPNTETYIFAKAVDKYGNETPESNKVKVTVTTNNPFKSIEIIPALTGVNDSTAYANIQYKLDNGLEITAADISALRTIVFRSTVNQGTEYVKFSYNDLTNVSELPATDPKYIGYIDGANETKLYKSYGASTPVLCTSIECTWDFYYPVPPLNGGLYEVEFEGKLDVEIETLTAAFTVDGNIPTAPVILDVNRINADGTSSNLKVYDNTYYSNIAKIQLTGAADPSANITVTDQNGNTLCTTTSNSIGLWSCIVDSSAFYDPTSANVNLQLDVTATKGLTTSTSLTPTNVVIDVIIPEFVNVTLDNQWKRSGDSAEVDIVASEYLDYAFHKDIDSNVVGSQCINATATYGFLNLPVQLGAIYDMNLKSNTSQAIGAFNISGNAVEGRYCTTLEIADRAGNRNNTGVTFFIDNTVPDVPFIITDGWGIYNGIKTQPTFIALGRTNPEYVHEENTVKIRGYAEENQYIQLYVDGKLVQEVLMADSSSSSSCRPTLDENNEDRIMNKEIDTVITEYNYQCPYEFTYLFTTEKGYLFQLKARDRANNITLISEDEVIYYDITAPKKPIVTNVSSPSYNPTPLWEVGKMNAITKDLQATLRTYGEARADSEIWAKNPQGVALSGVEGYQFAQNAGSGFLDSTFALGSQEDDRNNCVKTVDGRRTGICEDGFYKFDIQHTDAAGNRSLVLQNFQIERDTVKPAKANISASVQGGIGQERLKIGISGEKNTLAIIKITAPGFSTTVFKPLNSSGNFSTNDLIGILNCGYQEYSILVSLKDLAGNISDFTATTVKTGECPRCGYAGGQLAWPVRDNRSSITSGYQNPRPDHDAIDIAVGSPETSWRTPIYATGPGKVIEARFHGGSPGGSANYVKVRQDDGKVIYFWHLDNEKEGEEPVYIGKRVDMNTLVGHMGNTGHVHPLPKDTGNPKSGTHLHFAVYINGSPVNPTNFLGEGANVECDKGGVLGDNNIVDMQLIIDQIEILDELYSNEAVVGILFRMFEPEGYWDDSAPQTEKYSVRKNLPDSCKDDTSKCTREDYKQALLKTLPDCKKDGCKEKAIEAIEKILGMVGCNVGEYSCAVKDGGYKLVQGKYGDKFDIGHLFAGLSRKYFENQSWRFDLLARASDFELYWKFRTIGTASRTYVGDIGGVIQKATRNGRHENADAANEREKKEVKYQFGDIKYDSFTWGSDDSKFKEEDVRKSNLAIVAWRGYEGLIQKGDLVSDIDSEIVRALLSNDGNLQVHESLNLYYYEKPDYNKYKYHIFGKAINLKFTGDLSTGDLKFDKEAMKTSYPNQEAMDIFTNIKESSAVFAVMFDVNQENTSCDIIPDGKFCTILVKGISEEHENAIRYYAFHSTYIMYEFLLQEILYVDGVVTNNERIDDEDIIYKNLLAHF